MALIHSEDMDLWREWSRSRHRAREAKHAATGAVRTLLLGTETPEGGAAWRISRRDGESGPVLLIAVDSPSPTARASQLTALPYLRRTVDVLTPVDVDLPELTGPEWHHEYTADPERALRIRGIGAVLTIGQHLAAGRVAHALAAREDLPAYVVQHGALTPYAPPLPRETTLLAWSDADGDFYRSGRTDVQTTTVGSQMLWQAAHDRADGNPVQQERPVFLGQLHGAELSRRLLGRAAVDACRRTGALYRPHPAETDVLSRTQHRLWQRRGIEFAPTDVPLRDLASPVIAVFSTGVLEAAARGIPSWVHAPGAPRWIYEFWDRYRMRRLGGSEPTPAPADPGEEPSARLATLLEDDAVTGAPESA